MRYIGTSGFYYSKWVGEFYPLSIMKYHYFDYYANIFNSLELNSTFYRFPKTQTMRSWKYKIKKYPEFKLSVKVNRTVTHKYRLQNVSVMMDFIKSVEILGEYLGVILLQLPPGLKYDILTLEEFLKPLNYKYRYAIEFRNDSWYRLETFSLLKEKNVALVAHDYRQKFFYKKTADFDYIRLHGFNGKYYGSYPDEFLQSFKDLLQETSYIYFNNTDDNSAFKDAKRLKEILK